MLKPQLINPKFKRDSLRQKDRIQSAKFQTGFTLVELTVALGIFVTVIAISMGILLDSLKTLRHVANQARAIDNISLAIEQMVREIRTGSNIDLSSLPDNGFTQQVVFTNYEGDRVIYSFYGEGIQRGTSQEGVFPITSENINVTGGFIITDFRIPNTNTPRKTPRITVAAKATDARNNILGFVQTTVSARLIHYKPL